MRDLLLAGAVFAAFVMIVAYWYRNDPTEKQKDDESRRELLAACDSIIEIHAPELLRKRRQLIEGKGYGLSDRTKWEKEKDFFIREIVRPVLPFESKELTNQDLISRIDACLDTIARTSKNPSPPDQGKPIDFEHFCATLLERAGWQVSTTPASGDQGADVIAKKGNKSIVLQCKQYSKPVGNAAVQEAFAAKSHYGTTHAAVVTNAGYTKAATILAASTGVLLLDPNDLPNVDGAIATTRR